MPETTRRHERAELVVAVVIAAIVMTGAYLIGDQLPFPIAFVVVLAAAAGLTLLATYSMDRPEDHR
ncbi:MULTISPECIES: hypothetical protein [unclassified Streptomyces]|uniref:hypothetical protein n=1 Tax=unclassified Streptomyces TaxID=2593676 RepID=UPI00088BBAF1|nr:MULTISPECIES: hypothetical protein [unclassified Streptomyces]PBC72313.1 hypothetical protein BX261_7397 [Streptomyces sp. 2321.6]SDR62201.1 hypothetical protein SAMN05216511_7306 [Streptomyces sp. KS_16]SEE51036.1 hypothetical protein SAMN05428940_7355 [Streptomyces sp. 2133.1]SNC77817.1 hypothetical protein SAMN06272741_7233 [Streptomyces sp. 2114.4]